MYILQDWFQKNRVSGAYQNRIDNTMQILNMLSEMYRIPPSQKFAIFTYKILIIIYCLLIFYC